MEAPSEGWRKDEQAPPEKPAKRKMKSPYQLEVLEKTYAVEAYPSEALRAELSAKIGLSDRQLQMWFCHRRLKDRKPPSAKKQRKEEEMLALPPLPPPPVGEVIAKSATTAESRKAVARMTVSAARAAAVEMPVAGIGKRHYDSGMIMVPVPPPSPRLLVAELRVIASVEAQLGEPLREDGPVLGMEFGPLPPGAFGAPIAIDTPTYLTHGRNATHQFLDRLENPDISFLTKHRACFYA